MNILAVIAFEGDVTSEIEFGHHVVFKLPVFKSDMLSHM